MKGWCLCFKAVPAIVFEVHDPHSWVEDWVFDLDLLDDPGIQFHSEGCNSVFDCGKASLISI